jgi:hypothetical protein
MPLTFTVWTEFGVVESNRVRLVPFVATSGTADADVVIAASTAMPMNVSRVDERRQGELGVVGVIELSLRSGCGPRRSHSSSAPRAPISLDASNEAS